MLQDRYELSIWQDKITTAASGVTERFSEVKSAIIGADGSTSELSAFNVSLKETNNGDMTLTFSMFRKYYDRESKQILDNPFNSLITNEAHLKLRIGEPYPFNTVADLQSEDTDERWFDFVIKSIDDSSSEKVINVTAKQLFVNELGKNGSQILLNTELENNFGTLTELSKAVLKGSDWDIGVSYSPTERIEEPLLIGTISDAFQAKTMIGNRDKTISGYFYPFYSSCYWDSTTNQWKLKSGEVQFLYNEGKKFSSTAANDSRVIIDDDYTLNYFTTSSVKLSSLTLTGGDVDEPLNGNRVIRTQNYRFEKNANTYVKEFKVLSSSSGAAVGTTAFGFNDTEYLTGGSAKNFLTNYDKFTSNLGWVPQASAVSRIFPEPTSDIADWLKNPAFNYLVLKDGGWYTNNGPTGERLSLTKDKQYVVRIKGRWIVKNAKVYGPNGSNIRTTGFPVLIVKVQKKAGEVLTDVTTTSQIAPSDAIVNKGSSLADRGYAVKLANRNLRARYAHGTFNDEQGYFYTYLTALNSTKSVSDWLVFQIHSVSDGTHEFCIEDIGLFPYNEDTDGVPIFPNDAPTATIKEQFRYYNLVEDKINYLSGIDSYYAPIYRPNFESVRSIEVKDSNYFNNIQSLAERFEVWVRYKIYHKKNGEVLYANGKAKKEVIFSRYSAYGDSVNSAGFKYGVNLNDIKRYVDSDAIATKTIVKNNNQEFAKDGMCSISRAVDNISGENYIYNLHYYVNQGMLSYGQMLKDLYGLVHDDLALLPKLRELNERLSYHLNTYNTYDFEVVMLEEQVNLYNDQISAAINELEKLNLQLKGVVAADTNRRTPIIHAIAQTTLLRDSYILQRNLSQTRLNAYKGYRATAETTVKTISESKESLKLIFYKKYHRFIQEGTWVDENYVDDNLYYLDGQKISSVSAFPKVRYEIGVLDIQSISEYSGYNFKVGERTFIQDTEYFGYVTKMVEGIGSAKTPFRLEVIISERTRNFDDPSKSTILVQNYKTSYEELFQKIVASSQQLQLDTGSYNKGASVVTPDREFSRDTLEKTFANNSFILSGSTNQNVIIDTKRGIELVNNNNINERVRIVAGGIFISVDNGMTWRSAITGYGINTEYLLAGQIDVTKINLVHGSVPYFRWDKSGISAFYVNETDLTYDMERFVRHNQYGLYGTKTGTVLDKAVENAKNFDDKITAIENNSNFALTWRGLHLSSTDGSISLDPDYGLQLFSKFKFPQTTIDSYNFVVSPTKKRYTSDSLIPLIAIGKFYNRINDADPTFGLRMRDKEGFISLDTDNNGKVWVRDSFSVGQIGLLPEIDTVYSNVVGLTGKIIAKDIYINAIAPILKELGIEYEYPVIKDGETEPEFKIRERRFLQNMSIRLWAGAPSNVIEYSKFFVLENGAVYAKDAFIDGKIVARSGHIKGLLTIGENSLHGIDGTSYIDPDIPIDPAHPEGPYYPKPYRAIIWGGREITTQIKPDGSTEETISYAFSVDNKGVLQARNATIEGSIEMQTGKIHELFIPNGTSGISSKDEILLWINAPIVPDVVPYYKKDASSFYVTNIGEVYASTVYLKKSLYVGEEKEKISPESVEKYYITGINDLDYSLAFWAGASSADYTKSNFWVKHDGSVYAKFLDLSDGSLTANNVTVTGKLSVLRDVSRKLGFVIDSQEGIYTTNYNDFLGWKIDTLGNAFFNNVSLRGELKSISFEYQSKNVLGGDLLISPSYIDSEGVSEISFVGTNNDSFEYLVTTPISTSAKDKYSWLLESKTKFHIRLQCNLSDSTLVFKEYNDLNGNSRIVSKSGKWVIESTIRILIKEVTWVIGSEFLESGTVIIGLGRSGINLTASSLGGPSIQIFKMDTSANETIVTQLGALDGIQDSLLGVLSGTGLYASNAFLSGKVYLPNAGITNEEVIGRPNDAKKDAPIDKRVRFWAGCPPEEKETAPFMVTHDGRLFATSGKFAGEIEATDSTFSGFLKTAGLLIDPDEKNSPGINESGVLYVAYDNRETTGFPTIDDKILQIDRNGLSIWEGGLHAYSDYEAGWRDSYLIVGDNQFNPTIDSTTSGCTASFSEPNLNIKVIGTPTINSEVFFTQHLKAGVQYILSIKRTQGTFPPLKTFSLVIYNNISINTGNEYEIIKFDLNKGLNHPFKLKPNSTGKLMEVQAIGIRFDKDVANLNMTFEELQINIIPQGSPLVPKPYTPYKGGFTSVKTSLPTPLYGYEGTVSKESPYPYVSIIDDEHSRLYATEFHVGKGFVSADFLTTTFKSIGMQNGFLQFSSKVHNTTADFTTIEREQYTLTANWRIGIQNETELIIKQDNDKGVTIVKKMEEEVSVNVDGDVAVTNNLHTEKTLSFGDKVTVKQFFKSEKDYGLDFIVKGV